MRDRRLENKTDRRIEQQKVKDRRLDPLALSLFCVQRGAVMGLCACRVVPGTIDGVLYDWCPVHGEVRVPLRRGLSLPAWENATPPADDDLPAEVQPVNPRRLAEWTALLQKAS